MLTTAMVIREKDEEQDEEKESNTFNDRQQSARRLKTAPPQEFFTLQETIDKLGHQNRVIDVFKIDCESCEWTTYKDWLESEVDIRQILVKVHNVPYQTIVFFTAVQNAGYVTFHKEPNTQYADGNCQEYCFLKLNQSFFS
jgi:hypothetical protein